LKIAQVNVYFKPFMVGGAEWYVYNMSKRLVQLGHEVHVFTVNKYDGQTAPAEEEIEGIKVHRFPLRIDWSYRLKVWNSSFGKLLEQGNFDIIHSYDYPQWHSRKALNVAKKAGAGSLLTVFDVHSMIPRSRYKQVPMKLFERFFAKRILNASDRILVRAPMLISPLVKIGADERKIIVTPSGINDEVLSDAFDGDRFRNKYKIDKSPLILCLSRLNPLKGPQHLIGALPEILKKFPSAGVAFVGPDQSGYSEQLRILSNRLGVENHVFFTGPIYDQNEKMDAYDACDLFVLPSSYEGTSQAIFDAMARAKPIISTETGGIPFQIESGKDGILVPYIETQMDKLLSDAIIKLLEDRALAANLGNAARDKVQAFRYSGLSTDLVKIYENVARKKSQ
jgi:glycosyltransferase involved in cell wall biosynthesis